MPVEALKPVLHNNVPRAYRSPHEEMRTESSLIQDEVVSGKVNFSLVDLRRFQTRSTAVEFLVEGHPNMSCGAFSC